MRIFEIKPNDKTDAVSLAIRNDFLDDKRIYHSVARAFRLEYAKKRIRVTGKRLLRPFLKLRKP